MERQANEKGVTKNMKFIIDRKDIQIYIYISLIYILYTHTKYKHINRRKGDQIPCGKRQ